MINLSKELGVGYLCIVFFLLVLLGTTWHFDSIEKKDLRQQVEVHKEAEKWQLQLIINQSLVIDSLEKALIPDSMVVNNKK